MKLKLHRAAVMHRLRAVARSYSEENTHTGKSGEYALARISSRDLRSVLFNSKISLHRQRHYLNLDHFSEFSLGLPGDSDVSPGSGVD